MPAAKYIPANANFIEPPLPGVQQAQFAPNFEPPATPCASVPGELESEKPMVDHQQRGQSSFKGSDSNKQSGANE
eukprot:3932357-Alexandrium_andersonii.AAC.1